MEHNLHLAVVCRVLDASRSTVYARRAHTDPLARPGPATSISDDQLVRLLRRVLADSPFAGEGYRKLRARLRREHGVQISGKRVLRLLRQEGLLAPSGSVAAASPGLMTARSSRGAEPAVGHRRDHGLDPDRRLGVGVLRGGSLHRRGVGACGQDRRPLRRPPAGL